ncbi:MAG: hypothetical protein ABIO70_21645 [Pseudomonadota bacterium]
MLPSTFSALASLLLACSDQAAPQVPSLPPAAAPSAVRVAPAGQESPLPSPDGRWVARVPITAVPGREFATWWLPAIADAEGLTRYADPAGFPARFNVYWAWDAEDRLWLYETDEGGLWVYAEEGGEWTKRAPREGEAPPESIAARRRR